MSGSDPEDCAASGSCNGGQQGILSTFIIGAIGSNTRVFYDFGENKGVTEVHTGTVIHEYDNTKMVLYGKILNRQSENDFKFTYAMVDRAGVAGEYSAYGIKAQTPLPVVFLHFDVRKDGNLAALTWTTANEQNNLGFEIQRSKDGAIWSKVDFVISKANNGNSLTQLNYQYWDKYPSTGINLYRLKQVDFNGASNFSQMKSVTFGDAPNIEIFPNPTDDYFIIQGLQDNEIIKILDMTGKIIFAGGGNRYQEVSLKGYLSGMYQIIVLRPDGTSEVFKMIKL